MNNYDFSRTLSKSFQIFIGIDQTGATKGSGQITEDRPAKALPICVVFRKQNSWHLKASTTSGKKLSLSSFNETEIIKTLSEAGIATLDDHPNETYCILIDCVFGLAEKVWAVDSPLGIDGLWRLFDRAATNTQTRSGYGLKAAADFFSEVLAESNDRDFQKLPRRRCESLANANSVFQTHPYQKNIQCGTYRIWRDLGASKRQWLNIRYFMKRRQILKNSPWAFEAYPSLLWREILHTTKRKPEILVHALEKEIPELKIANADKEIIGKFPDWADAAVLASGGYFLNKKGALFQSAPARHPWLGKEGWIIGLSDGSRN